MTSSTYAIEGGRAGKARLDVLNRMMEPITARLLDRVDIPTGATCLDVGCGGGHVTLELARRVGPGGRVVGIDFDADAVVLSLARADAAAAGMANVEFRAGDATDLDRAGLGGEFDVPGGRCRGDGCDPTAVPIMGDRAWSAGLTPSRLSYLPTGR
jgi:2-polyprenyl-3-methyl-5-hydroxy-6-metoxy-1,4-benzoquinol methylase